MEARLAVLPPALLRHPLRPRNTPSFPTSKCRSRTAPAKQLFWQICEQIAKETKKSGYVPEELHELSKLLADQYVCNFSVFQSLLDHWALGQLFPVAPLHRLTEKPSVDAILVDITCDSDGKISHFIDLQDVQDYVPLQTPEKKELRELG